jgi:hypothetical protein
MKRFIPLLALFAAGVVASIALAAPPPGHGKPTSSTSTATSPGKSGDHGNKCHPMNLKGVVSGGTIALNVTKASGPAGGQLNGTTATLTVSGNVSVQAWTCGTAGSSSTPTLFLRQLHVGGKPGAQTSTTTAPSP